VAKRDEKSLHDNTNKTHRDSILTVALSVSIEFSRYPYDEFDHTFALLFGSTADLDENASVSVAYHDQREPVHGHHAEE